MAATSYYDDDDHEFEHPPGVVDGTPPLDNVEAAHGAYVEACNALADEYLTKAGILINRYEALKTPI